MVVFGALAPPANAQVAGLNSFYGENSGVHDIPGFVARMSDPHLRKMPPEELVDAFNNFVGGKIGVQVGSFGELMSLLESGRFEVVRCGEAFPDLRFRTVGWRFEHGRRMFHTFDRTCYYRGAEQLIIDRQTGVVAFSLMCGNLADIVWVPPTPQYVPPAAAYVPPPPPPMQTSVLRNICPNLGGECYDPDEPARSGWNLSSPGDQPSKLYGPIVLNPRIYNSPYN
jgi:hypothetical protein